MSEQHVNTSDGVEFVARVAAKFAEVAGIAPVVFKANTGVATSTYRTSYGSLACYDADTHFSAVTPTSTVEFHVRLHLNVHPDATYPQPGTQLRVAVGCVEVERLTVHADRPWDKDVDHSVVHSAYEGPFIIEDHLVHVAVEAVCELVSSEIEAANNPASLELVNPYC